MTLSEQRPSLREFGWRVLRGRFPDDAFRAEDQAGTESPFSQACQAGSSRRT